ncbi:hypothetical protein AB9K41_13685, partial [Cribrihabitans sp. XS_ASV171]
MTERTVMLPPEANTSPKAWLRAQVKSPLGLVLNIAMLALIIKAVPPLVSWALLDATWSGADMNACPPKGGACWAFIDAKMRLILFATYPYEEHWRAMLATLILVALVLVSMNPLFWTRKLLIGWALGLVAYGVLMWGG